jgi:hypothetical protein
MIESYMVILLPAVLLAGLFAGWRLGRTSIADVLAGSRAMRAMLRDVISENAKLRQHNRQIVSRLMARTHAVAAPREAGDNGFAEALQEALGGSTQRRPVVLDGAHRKRVMERMRSGETEDAVDYAGFGPVNEDER